MVSEFSVSILAAGSTTLLLALSSLVLATVIGLAAAFAKLSENRFLRRTAAVYTFVIRGIPDLVWMLLIFYSLPSLLNQTAGALGWDIRFEFPPIGAAIGTLGLIFGAYMTETFRMALLNIPKGQVEAALAYGLPKSAIFLRIILPQLTRLALPGFTNNWLVLAKATALASLIGLHDVMFRAKGAAEATSKPFTFFLVAAAFYLTLTVCSMIVLSIVAKRTSLGLKELAP
ncbi:ABC transporter permease subunit [Agrobacterium tumefaciens]|uniref:Arginine/ornithine transport system permease protein n=1 Tax=Agrobacterium tumefaciens TaxID=358 RepID=A0A2L2LKY0_AGRTU|nr:arginine/ornithine transport system permease protein [Agrobacterium tumefaciens]NSY98878.1 ABC transporter permease subunit [Agrobacterium tumefaciens]